MSVTTVLVVDDERIVREVAVRYLERAGFATQEAADGHAARRLLEREPPDLKTPDSPTLRVGAEPASELVKHRHAVPMLSLANAFDQAELDAWETRNAKLAPAVREAGYTLEVKIDGAAVSLT